MTGDTTRTTDTPATVADAGARVTLTGGGLQIRREGQPVRSTVLRRGAVYLVVDCSSSMAGEKIVQARAGALRFAVEAAATSYAVGLIGFSSRASLLCEPREDVAHVEQHLPRLEPGGTTNMARGIALAAENLAGRHGPLAMVVVTDGVPDDGAAALAAAQKATTVGIDVITVGTDDADAAFLRKLASRSGLAAVVDDRHLGEGIGTAAKMLTGR